MRDRISGAIEAGDLDELVRVIDALCAARDWTALLDVRDRARRALERGRQLWPAASHAEYRLALEAPGEFAARVLVEGSGRFAVGPIAEVAASTHTWGELAIHLDPGPIGALFAHERVVRGDDLSGEDIKHAEVLGVPMYLAPFEPSYLVATYHHDRVDAPAPELPRGRPLALPGSVDVRVDGASRDVKRALLDVVRAWTDSSEGSARASAVDGGALAAITALGVSEARGAWLDPAEALALLAWAGASGGSRGRRRGAAAGRDLTWAAAGALAGFAPGEPLDADELGSVVGRLRFVVWNAPDAVTGWVLRLAVEDTGQGVAYAIDALDRR